MAKKDRTGNRKGRNSRTPIRVPRMGYYIIVTDAEGTEPNYFRGIHESLPGDVKDRLVIKVVETLTQDMISKCLELAAYDSQYRIPWIVFDRDQVTDFDDIIRKAEKAGIHVGWSNPCFEIWLFAYFGRMPAVVDSGLCCAKFAELFGHKTDLKYVKSDKDLYKKLCSFGDEERAVRIANQKYKHIVEAGYTKPSEMSPCTTVQKLIEEIRGKVKNKKENNTCG